MKIKSSLFLIIAIFAWSFPALAETGEKVTPMVMGKMVHVNNRICASSHTPMTEGSLGQFTSQVVYEGSDPRYAKFKGKTLIFNQCCTDCITKFKAQWKDNPEAIMQFHGLR